VIGDGRRRSAQLAPGPGPGVEPRADRQRQAVIVARIAIVATIVVGQLWALTIALDAYFLEEMATVWWLLAFQVVSFLLALVVWWSAPSDR
jgi:hypothetical protein